MPAAQHEGAKHVTKTRRMRGRGASRGRGAAPHALQKIPRPSARSVPSAVPPEAGACWHAHRGPMRPLSMRAWRTLAHFTPPFTARSITQRPFLVGPSKCRPITESSLMYFKTVRLETPSLSAIIWVFNRLSALIIFRTESAPADRRSSELSGELSGELSVVVSWGMGLNS